MTVTYENKDLLARLEKDLRTANAAQRVNSLIALHVLMRVAMKTDEPQDFVSSIMNDIEQELLRAAKSTESMPFARRDADDAVTFFNMVKVAVTRSITKYPQRP